MSNHEGQYHLHPIDIIVATGNKGVIGHKDSLPWGHVPEDMEHFKKKTMGSFVVVGFKTLVSISRKLGRRNNLLPGRTLYVLTHKADTASLLFSGCIPLPDVQSVLALRKNKKVFIAGGREVYQQFLCLSEVRVIHMTRFYGDFHGDTYFPMLPPEEWRTFSNDFRPGDEVRGRPAMAFQTLIRC